MCQETIGAQAKQWKVLTNRATVKEKYKGAQGFLERMRSLVEDVSECVESTDNNSVCLSRSTRCLISSSG